jgi:hypothetical protein
MRRDLTCQPVRCSYRLKAVVCADARETAAADDDQHCPPHRRFPTKQENSELGPSLSGLSRRSTARAADGESAAQLGIGEAARALELTDAADDNQRLDRAASRRCRGHRDRSTRNSDPDSSQRPGAPALRDSCSEPAAPQPLLRARQGGNSRSGRCATVRRYRCRLDPGRGCTTAIGGSAVTSSRP